jgi:ribonuclease J
MVKVNILGGAESIGGNFVRIEDGDRVLIFDQGIRFDIMANYYTPFITPRSIAELRDLGALPKSEWYRGASEIYISHMHLDHLGALSNIPERANVHLPSLTVYESLEEKWRESPTWLSLIPRKYFVNLEEQKPLETDKNDVMAIPVSHSAHPSYALLYFGKDETVLYTGDFRVESFLEKEEFVKIKGGEDLFTYLGENKDLKVDTLIIEGTNIGSSRPPITPADASKMIKEIALNHRPIIATLHPLDIEYAHFMAKLATELGMKCYVASEHTARLLEKFPHQPLKPAIIEEYVSYPTFLEKSTLDDVEEHSLILVSYREVADLLRDLASINPSLLKDAVSIISEPEPEREEAIEYSVLANWFMKVGVQHYTIRASGHYYPYQLKRIIAEIRPKNVLPIHTERPRLFSKNLDRLRSQTYEVENNSLESAMTVSVREPSYDEIKDLAQKLYFARNPEITQPSDETLKVEGYWTKARLILQGKMEMPKYAKKAIYSRRVYHIPKEFYSKEAHLERLKDLLSWAKEEGQVQKCLKNKAFKKATRLIAEEAINRYGVDKRYAVQYARMVLARLKSKVEIQTKWGLI